jgi:hypothetical protein
MVSAYADAWAVITGKRLIQANGVICPMTTLPH